jgi:hypothetical protein
MVLSVMVISYKATPITSSVIGMVYWAIATIYSGMKICCEEAITKCVEVSMILTVMGIALKVI